MSTVIDDATDVDLKAGFSSYCRRGNHESCATARARCSCTCHGPAGQLPPTPAPPSARPPAAAAALVRPAPKETTVPDATKYHECPVGGCDRSFGSAHALLIHRSRKHRGDAASSPAASSTAPPPSQPKRPRSKAAAKGAARPAPQRRLAAVPPSALDAGGDAWAVVVGMVIDGVPSIESAIFSTKTDAERATGLLAACGQSACTFEISGESA